MVTKENYKKKYVILRKNPGKQLIFFSFEILNTKVLFMGGNFKKGKYKEKLVKRGKMKEKIDVSY